MATVLTVPLMVAVGLGVLRVHESLSAATVQVHWTFIFPCIMSTLSGLDRSGRLVNLANIAVGGGFTLGPFMGGRLIESAGLRDTDRGQRRRVARVAGTDPRGPGPAHHVPKVTGAAPKWSSRPEGRAYASQC